MGGHELIEKSDKKHFTKNLLLIYGCRWWHSEIWSVWGHSAAECLQQVNHSHTCLDKTVSVKAVAPMAWIFKAWTSILQARALSLYWLDAWLVMFNRLRTKTHLAGGKAGSCRVTDKGPTFPTLLAWGKGWCVNYYELPFEELDKARFLMFNKLNAGVTQTAPPQNLRKICGWLRMPWKFEIGWKRTTWSVNTLSQVDIKYPQMPCKFINPLESRVSFASFAIPVENTIHAHLCIFVFTPSDPNNCVLHGLQFSILVI